MELQVHGYELTLSLAEAEQIEIEQIRREADSHAGIEALKPGTSGTWRGWKVSF